MDEEQILKNKELNYISNKLGIALMVSFFIMLILGFSFFIVLNLSNPNLENNNLSLYSIYYFCINSICSLVSLTIPFIVVLKKVNLKISDILVFKKINLKFLLAIIGLGLGISLYANIASAQLQSNLKIFNINFEELKLPLGKNFLSIFIDYISIALIPALFEEFAFRGVILGLLRKFGDGLAVIVSSVLFSLFHANMIQIPFAFIVGLILGFIFVKTNSLLPSMLIHFLSNFFSVTLILFSKQFPEKIVNNLYLIFSCVLIVFFIFSLFYINKNYKDFFYLKKDKNKISTAFNSCGIIICIAVFLIFSFKSIK